MNFGKMAIQQAGEDSRMVVCQRNSLVVAKNKLAEKYLESERERNHVISLAILFIVHNIK